MQILKDIRLKSIWAWIRTSVWSFPVLLLIFFSFLVVLKIHGSSIGVYHGFFYGSEASDPDLIYGTPKPIRSDEWLGGTQATALQDKTGFPSFNKKIGGSGRDMTKITDAPTKDWVTIFRPHNWSFFILPFENAFAARWWLMLYALIVSCYFFILKILPKRVFLAITISVAFALSPFILWWYQTALFLPLAYGFLLMLLGMKSIDKDKLPKTNSPRVRDLLYIVGFVFLGLSTAFLLYPPFSIPVFLVVAFYLIGYMYQQKLTANYKLGYLAKRCIIFVVSAVVIAGFGYAYLNQHSDMISKLSASKYPGQRISASGKLNPLSIADGFLMPPLQGQSRGANYYANQSEAGNYILLLPFLIVPSIGLQIYQFKKSRKIDWVFLAINLTAVLFLRL